ncbi:hypothetical protein GGI43DRAFT_413336 [Trichoderma evansii]
MAEYTIYTRVYSEGSAGKLSSAKEFTGNALTQTELLDEFRNHANRRSKRPTALISVSSRIVDTVRRAFKKCYTYCESPEDIWIAFIKVPVTVQVHAAQPLAKECGLPTPGLLRYEYLFEWVIPDEYVLHRVSLQTLMDRGLDWEQYIFADGHDDEVVSTSKLRKRVAENLIPQDILYGDEHWAVGLDLALFAQNFGARAPVDWIAHQLFYDCVGREISDDDMERGIVTGLYEWWLGDIDFYIDRKEFDEWQDAMEDGIIWDQIEFWKTWGQHDYDELSEEDKLLQDKEWDELWAERKKIMSAIEVEAVKIGL